MLILGLNAFHADASAAILRDGKLVAAAEEERFRRVKHWAGFPLQAVTYCLAEAGAGLADIDYVAVNQDSRANLIEKLKFLLLKQPGFGLILNRLRNRNARADVEQLLSSMEPKGSFRATIMYVEHHLAHLASAFNVSPFKEATVVSIDGFGDFASAAWGIGEGVSIDVEDRVLFPHSLGIFYQALTQYLGFPNYGDEYKVMGLAPYGKRSSVSDIRKLIKLNEDGSFELAIEYFRHHREVIAFEWDNGTPEFSDLFSPALEELLGPRRLGNDPLEQRHMDIAHSAQLVYEEAFFHLISSLQKRHGTSDIALAGGCAMNSVANGKIRRLTPFRRVYVQSAAGDAGGAIGAALVVWTNKGGGRSFVMDHAYWGPSFDGAAVAALLKVNNVRLGEMGCTSEIRTSEEELCHLVASEIAQGKVIGWFQGRMEWGPRALGNRSILCDPRRGDMKTILNAKIKRRESFRPFAPSILEEAVGDWFEEDDDVPFMMQVFQIREARRAQIPAVTHVDGSGRLQTVKKSANPRYHKLISAFAELTGVPMVLNTSFNENEPVVCKPQEALDCFLRTKMDVLVLGNTMIYRMNRDHGRS